MDELKRLFAVIIVYRHNIHMLHWKASGSHFDCIHKLCDDYVDHFNGLVDEIAEMILMLGEVPLTLHECFELVDNDSSHEYIIISASEDYDEEDTAEHIGTMFNDIMSIYDEIYSKDELPKDIIASIDGQMGWFRLENHYKNRQRLK